VASKNIKGIITWLRDWFYDKTEINNSEPEYIVGTHGTSTTASWTGTCSKLTEIKDGTTIFYYLTSAGTSNVTLNLTLANGQTTGAKNVYFKGTTRLSNQYPINSIITLVYTTKKDNGAWYVSSANDNNSYNAYHYGTVQFTAGEKLTTRTLCGMMSNGKYYKISSGRQFLTAYPIIGTNGEIAVNATGNNEYMPRYDEAITNTKSMTLTNGKPVFIEGSAYRNGVFTVSSNVVTQTLVQGNYYWLVGFAYGNSNFRSNRYENILYYNGTNLIPVAYPLSHSHSGSDITLESGVPFLSDNEDYIYFLNDKLEYDVNQDIINYNSSEVANKDDLSSKVDKETNKALFPSSNYIIDQNTPFSYKISSNQTQSLFSVINTSISQSGTSIADTGWVQVTLNSTNASQSSSMPLYIRKYGNQVTLTGVVTLKKAIATSSSLNIATLPAEYRPTIDVMTTVNGNKVYGHIYVQPDGSVIVNNRSDTSWASNGYVVIGISYFV